MIHTSMPSPPSDLSRPGSIGALARQKLDPDDLFHSKFTLRPAEH
jgi:hypothetical protein